MDGQLFKKLKNCFKSTFTLFNFRLLSWLGKNISPVERRKIRNLAVLTVYVPPAHRNDIIHATSLIPHVESIQTMIRPTWQQYREVS